MARANAQIGDSNQINHCAESWVPLLRLMLLAGGGGWVQRGDRGVEGIANIEAAHVCGINGCLAVRLWFASHEYVTLHRIGQNKSLDVAGCCWW